MARKKLEPKKIELTDEQELVVAALEGAYRVAASPGSGKSSVLVQRYIRLLQSGVSVDNILSLTFTSTSAKNLRDRVEERAGKLSINRKVAGACTFHSLCLSLAVEERAEYPFELEEFPLATEPVAAKFSAIAASKYEVDPRSLRSAISLYKRRKIRPAEAVKIAENHLKASELKTALAYKMYDKSLRDNKVLDFDSLILEGVELLSKKKEVRNRWQYQYCHPPGTMVAVAGKYRSQDIELSEVPIESLKNGDYVIAWDRLKKRVPVRLPKRISVGTRKYSGAMLNVIAGGKSVPMTPNHQVWVRMVNTEEKFFTYLMWREGYGFRVGVVNAKKSGGGNGFWQRCRGSEKADAGWVLKVSDTKKEALFWEAFYSIKYQIPEHCYTSQDGNVPRIFQKIDTESGGRRCLQDCGRLFEYPYYEQGVLEKYGRKPKQAGFFITAASNILPGYMQIPLPDEQSSALIDRVDRTQYSGPVYSLEVDDLHTYIANGVVVANCQVDEAQDCCEIEWQLIQLLTEKHRNLVAVGDANQNLYSFRGSNAELFVNMEQMFPETKKLFLGRNFRSTPEIVGFVKEIGTFRELCEHFTTENEHGPAPLVRGFLDATAEAKWIISRRKGEV